MTRAASMPPSHPADRSEAGRTVGRRALLGLGLAGIAGAGLAACSSGSSSPTPTSPAGTPTPTEWAAAPPTSGAFATTGASGAVIAAPDTLPSSFIDVNKTITDPDLGHSIVVTRIARDLPWPAGYVASSQAFELVAVEMRWTTGTQYTAQLRSADFTIFSGGTTPNNVVSIVNPILQQAGWAVLPATLDQGKTATGFLIFRVDPKDAPALRLDYTRPASKVSGTSQTFPSLVVSAQLVG